jgi:hypothetical protein
LPGAERPPTGAEQVYLVAMRGHFSCSGCPGPLGAGAPTGTVMTLELPVTSGGHGLGISGRYPDLGLLGVPVRLG